MPAARQRLAIRICKSTSRRYAPLARNPRESMSSARQTIRAPQATKVHLRSAPGRSGRDPEQCVQMQCLSEMLRVRAHVRAKMQLEHEQWIHAEQLIQPEKPP
jgi:hypothetical protein